MRTTIDLPDDLARAAKVRAAERGETLKEMLTRAIAREVAADPHSKRTGRVALPLVAAGADATVDVTSEDIAAALAAGDERYAE
jgi:hypothetical protein